jgi:hypothetical protein
MWRVGSGQKEKYENHTQQHCITNLMINDAVGKIPISALEAFIRLKN